MNETKFELEHVIDIVTQLTQGTQKTQIFFFPVIFFYFFSGSSIGLPLCSAFCDWASTIVVGAFSELRHCVCVRVLVPLSLIKIVAWLIRG